MFVCIQCGNLNKNKKNSKNKFCNPACCGKYTFEKITFEKFLRGEVTERATIRKCISHAIGYFCSICKLSEWNDKVITLQVDHIDGIADNNHPTNLRLLCPNCHSQTDSFSGKNKGNGRKARGLNLK